MKRVNVFLLLALTSLLVLLLLAPRLCAADLLPPQILRVPPGWTASEEGYWLSTSALQLLVADAESWEATAKAWEVAYDELQEQSLKAAQKLRDELNQINESLEAERAAARRKSRQAARTPGLGIFAGYGTGGATVGVGIVWRLF